MSGVSLLLSFIGCRAMKETVIALCDCQSFYCSCESVFEPRLWSTPLVVLSNNDGAIVALNEAAKALGVKKFEPFFKFRHLMHTANLQARSSNYTLYNDLSSRVMETLRLFSPAVERYSIDEAFFALDHVPAHSRSDYARQIRATLQQHTGIPTRIGIAETKTLAKVALSFAKRFPALDGVLDITGSAQQQELLAALPIADVWGIGQRWGRFLSAEGIETALKLRDAPQSWVRQKLSVVGLRTSLELRGCPCLHLELQAPPRKSMMVSRSFGQPVRSLQELQEAIATFTAKAAHKLRQERLVAGMITVFAHTSRFKENYYKNSAKCHLWIASNHTPTLLKYAMVLVKKIWKEEVEFKKAGVLLTRITDQGVIQLSLFEDFSFEDTRPQQLMQVVDELNSLSGQDVVHFAAMGTEQRWQTRAQFRSNRWTTRWEEIPI
ncbi:MAG TPA: Y-family DNA polymerase, partial [Candidatus Caenarcaniphilales bacterium]